MIMFEENTSKVAQEIVLLVTGLGLGCFFQAPLIGLQASMPLRDMAVSTAVLVLLRTLGGTVGIAVGDTIFSSEIKRRLAGIDLSDTSGAVSMQKGNVGVLIDFKGLQQIEVRHAARFIFIGWLSFV